MPNIVIRSAVPEDAEALLAIYAPYVTDTAVSFEYAVPTLEDFRGRIAGTLSKYPYLVAEENGQPVGYCYAGAFKGRAAYDWSVETSIYLAPAAQGKGLGRRLYAALEAALGEMGVRNMYACISCPRVEDEYLTRRSVDFHAHLGYRLVGTFRSCASKFGRWYDMVWMEKFIGAHEEKPEGVRWRGEKR